MLKSYCKEHEHGKRLKYSLEKIKNLTKKLIKLKEDGDLIIKSRYR